MTLDADAGEGAVEHGHEQQREDGGDGEATDDGDTHRAPHLGALPPAEGHRHHAEDGRHGRHQHGAQAALASRHHGVLHRPTALAAEGDVVDQHDAVLDHDADQHDGAEEAHHVQCRPRQEEGHQHAAHRKGHGEHDDEGVRQRLELRRHDDEDEHNDEQGQDAEVGEGVLLILVRARDLDLHIARRLHAIDQLFPFGHDPAQRRARLRHSGDGHDAFAILALDGGRGEALHHGAHVAHPHGAALVVVDADVFNVLKAGAILRCVAHDDVRLRALLPILRGGVAIDAVAQVRAGGGEVEALHGELLAVEVHLILGQVIAAADVHLRDAIELQQLRAQLLRQLVGRGHVVAIDLKVGRSLPAHAAVFAAGHDFRLRELGVRLQVVAHHVADHRLRSFAFTGFRKAKVEGNDVGAVVAYRGEGVRGVGLPHGIAANGDLGVLLQPLRRQFGGQLLGYLLACAHGQFQLGGDVAVVLLGEELAADEARAEQTEYEEGNAHEYHEPPVAYGPTKEARVARIKGVEGALDGAIERSEELRGFTLQTQQARAKHRREREGGHGGNDHDDAHHPAQLLEEYTRHARDHRQGEEDGDHRQRGSDDGDGHLVRAVHSRLRRRRAALNVRRDVLQDHDGVVHHHTDGDGERGERDDVDRVARDG